MKRLQNQRIIVTGASRGIGAAIARRLAHEGARVALTYASRPESAQKVLSELEGQGHLALELKLEDEASVQKAISQVLGDWGGVEGLVNNAGLTRDQILLRMKVEDFDAVLRANLRGSFLCSREVLKPMMKARKGSIVHLTSVVGQTGNPGQANYTASKAGIEGFSRSLALEMASRNIRSNCVAPGFIESDMTQTLTEDQRKAMLDRIPLGSIGRPEDVANAVAFLLSEESAYITGQTLNVNGGMYLG